MLSPTSCGLRSRDDDRGGGEDAEDGKGKEVRSVTSSFGEGTPESHENNRSHFINSPYFECSSRKGLQQGVTGQTFDSDSFHLDPLLSRSHS